MVIMMARLSARRAALQRRGVAWGGTEDCGEAQVGGQDQLQRHHHDLVKAQQHTWLVNKAALQ
eukprot:SAG31_NODE_393_length_16293_cov_15.804372_4_plen_63_part_00